MRLPLAQPINQARPRSNTHPAEPIGCNHPALQRVPQASKLPAAVDRAWEGMGGGPSDLTFPGDPFLGEWDVESVLASVETPLGPEFVRDAQVRILCVGCVGWVGCWLGFCPLPWAACAAPLTLGRRLDSCPSLPRQRCPSKRAARPTPEPAVSLHPR